MIKLFSTGCPKCKVVEAKLKQKGITFEVESDVNTIIEKGKELNILSAPILQIDDKFYDFKGAIAALKEA